MQLDATGPYRFVFRSSRLPFVMCVNTLVHAPAPLAELDAFCVFPIVQMYTFEACNAARPTLTL